MSGSTSDESQSSGDLVDEAAAAAPQSIGTYLAAQRRLRGISIEELSQQTRIPLRSLERLEAGSFDTDVDGFVRGFVRTVAEALGLDPDEALNRTLPEPGSPAGRGVAPQLSVRRVSSKGDASRPDSGAQIVVRRDPVRALAEAQGIAALPPAPALALAASQAAVSGTRSPDLAVPGELEPPGGPPLALPSTP
jgi:hypothetical protein